MEEVPRRNSLSLRDNERRRNLWPECSFEERRVAAGKGERSVLVKKRKRGRVS